MTDHNIHPDRNDPLARALARLYPAPSVPPQLDAAILHSAHQHLRRRRQFVIALRLGGAGAAIAASLLLAFHLTARTPAPTILDAYCLARQLQTHQIPDKRYDINHDGVIDQRDVRTLAQAAVQLKGAS